MVAMPARRGRTAARRWRTFYRHRLRPAWGDARPLVILSAAALVLVLGTIGFHRVSVLTHEHANGFDAFYRALTLFSFGGAAAPPVPWQLNVARILGPLLTGYAAIKGLLLLSRSQLQLLNIRLLARRHILIAGLGALGFRLADAFHEAGFKVVVIERDPNNPIIPSCRERGISVLQGDATDVRMLGRARADRATHVVAVCGDDSTNIGVTVSVGQIAGRRRGEPLDALVHVDDAGLWRMLQAHAVVSPLHHDLRIEFFNLPDIGARMLLDHHPPFPPGATHAHVLIAGIDGVADQLVLHITRLWRGTAQRGPLRLTLIEPHASERRADVLLRHPELHDLVDLHAQDLCVGTELLRCDLTAHIDADHPVTATFVCQTREADGLETALTLQDRSDLLGTPIVVAVDDTHSGVSTVLGERELDADGGITAFGVLTHALDMPLLLGGTNEILARAKHEDYVRSELGKGHTSRDNPSLVPWDELGESLRESNRRFADGIGGKLAAAGCLLIPAPLIDPDTVSSPFSAEEVEDLARMEHDRWRRDLEAGGWRPGPVKDPERKLHPLLVGWSELSEEERDKDREPIRLLPRMLADAGFEISRRTDAGAQQPAPPPVAAGR